jgi:multiple sugar transport system permease protein
MTMTTPFQSIPTTPDEAARVDGAGWFRNDRSVVMPLAGPAIATAASPRPT